MKWVLIVGLSWLVVAFVVALLIGRVVRAADERERRECPGGRADIVRQPNHLVDDEPTGIIAEAAPERSSGNERPAPPGIRRPLDWPHDITSGQDYGAA